MTTVSPQAAAALEDAMRRLVDGQPQRTDGALTVANLAREAGISRATANRATEIVARFRAHTAARAEQADVPATLRERIRQLEAEVRELRSRERQEITDLRATVHTLAQHVQALTLENEVLRAAQADHKKILLLPTQTG